MVEHPLHILAVDDEPSVAHSLIFALAGPTRTLATAGDGDEALNLLAEDAPFDIIITDNNMPRVSGLELVRRLRAGNFAGKIVVLSAYLNDENRAAYAELGVDMVLSKPFELAALREAIENLAA